MSDEANDPVTSEGSLSSATPTDTRSFSKERLKYEDPFLANPSRKGMLLSNQIDWFCQRKALIEEGYKPENLRPASYTLTIGPDYVGSTGQVRKLTKKEPMFYMEPNSIVFVSTNEVLNLPFYIAARFNLRVKWVYRGILLGTGPQVEPGFRGNLSCPLFNLTDRAIKIRLGEEFATIDFERTTDFAEGPWEDLRDSRKTGESLDALKSNGEEFLLFKQKAFAPLKHLPDHDIVSSLVKLSDEVKTWRAIGVGIVIAFVSLALTLLNFQNNLYREQKSTSQQVNQLDRDLGIAKSQIDALRQPKQGQAMSVTPPERSQIGSSSTSKKPGTGSREIEPSRKD